MADDGPITLYSPEFWHEELEREGKRGGNKWRKRGRLAVERYRDERAEKDRGEKRFNILYSNVETLKPAISARTPIPAVSRRFVGEDAPTRIAGEILQKCLSFTLDDHDFDKEKERARDDGLLAGRGVLWVEYKSKIVRRTPKLAPAGPPPLGGPPGVPPAPQAIPGMAAASAGGAPPVQGMNGMGAGPVPPPMPGAPPGMGGPMLPGPEQSDPNALMAQVLAQGGPPAPAAPPAMGAPAPQYMLDGRPVEPDGTDDEGNPYVDEVVEESVCARHILWKDFRHTPINDWRKVWWVAYADYLTKHDAEDELGKAKAEKLTYTPSNSDGLDDKDEEQRKEPGRAQIWRIWCKRTKKLYVIAEGLKDELLSEKPLPFETESGFPCPEPWRPIGTTDKWEPIPEYAIYQDQAQEIDALTIRINALVEACRARGAAPSIVANALNDVANKKEGEVGPVEDYESLAEMGGFDKSIAWAPIEQLAKVIEILAKQRAAAIQELYQLTGISDLMRQSTAASETATAQQLKGNFGQMRLQPRQVPFERYVRDTLRIMAEVIGQKFNRRTLERMTGVQLGMTGNPELDEQGEQILKILRDAETRAYRIDVETDSMIMPDEQAEKQSVIEFVGAITKYLAEAVNVAGVDPALIPLLMEMLKAACRRFKMGRELEEVVDKTVEEHKELAEQRKNAPPPPDPAMAEVEGKLKIAAAEQQQKAQAEQAKQAAEQQAQQQQAAAEAHQREQDALNAEAERQAKIIEAQAKADIERQQAEDERRRAEEKHAAELREREAKALRDDEDARVKREMDTRDMALRENEDVRKGDEHTAKQEERAAKRTINENTVAETGAKRKHAEESAGLSREIIDTVRALSDTVKALGDAGETEAEKVNGKWRIRKIKAQAGKMN